MELTTRRGVDGMLNGAHDDARQLTEAAAAMAQAVIIAQEKEYLRNSDGS